MSNDWFNDYVYEVVVHKKYLTDKQKELAEGPITDLPAWGFISLISNKKASNCNEAFFIAYFNLRNLLQLVDNA